VKALQRERFVQPFAERRRRAGMGALEAVGELREPALREGGIAQTKRARGGAAMPAF
jgi:hypothetical protein